jgi:hypothetical protein
MPAYIFSGTRDSIVKQCVMNSVEQQLSSLGAHVHSVFDIPSAHGWVVDSRNFPGRFPRCGHPGWYYIENCEYDMSLQIFKIAGTLT